MKNFARIFFVLFLSTAATAQSLYTYAFYAAKPDGSYVPISLNTANALLTMAGAGHAAQAPPVNLYKAVVYGKMPDGSFQPVSLDATGALVVNDGGGGGTMVYPGAGIPISSGTAWSTSVAAPVGAIVGTTDMQTLTHKTLDAAILTDVTQADEIVANDFIGALNGVAIGGTPPVNGNVLLATDPTHAIWGNNSPTGTGFWTSTSGVRDSAARSILPQDLPATINSNTTGNANTASAFDHTPTSCPPVAGVTTYPTGVDAQGNGTGCSSPTGSGQPGSVTTITVDDIPGIANTTVATPSTTPHVSFTLFGAPAHSFWGNNTDTEDGSVGYSNITVADLPEEIAGTQAHNTVWAAPDAVNGIPTFRALLPADLHGLPTTNPIMSGSTTFGSLSYISATADLTLTSNSNLDFSTSGNVREMQLDSSGNLNYGVNLGKFMDTNRNIFAGSAGISGNSGLPTQVNGGLWLASGLPSPVIGRIYVGDGTGWHIDFARRIAGTDTSLISFFDTGAATFIGNITAPLFVGNLQGNATSATSVPYSGLTGTVPTWNQSTTGNAATATTAVNLSGSITETQVTGLVAALALKAPLASPALTGVPTAPTAASSTNTTQIATTAMVQAAIASETPVTEIFGQVTIDAGQSEGNDSSHPSISVSSVCVASAMNPMTSIPANPSPWNFLINVSQSNISIIAQSGPMLQKQTYSYMCKP